MCGVFGIYGHEEAANLTYLGLHALQHRGQESSGIVTNKEGEFYRHVSMGKVSEGFDAATIDKLPGASAVGHVRYSTSGSSEVRNAQPFSFDYAHGAISISHNGNLVNADKVRKQLVASGSIFQTSSDSEVLVHLLAQARQPQTIDRLVSALRQVTGAYSLLILTESRPVSYTHLTLPTICSV